MAFEVAPVHNVPDPDHPTGRRNAYRTIYEDENGTFINVGPRFSTREIAGLYADALNAVPLPADPDGDVINALVGG